MSPDPALQPQEKTEPNRGDEEREEMQRELSRIGLAGDLVTLVMKAEVSEVVTLASRVVVLPISILLQSASGDKGLDAEAMTLGLRHTIEALRPHGPTVSLAETLLSMARSSRGYVAFEEKIEQILEAIRILKTLKQDRRLGRAFLDLGLALRDNRYYYDALRAFDLARQSCAAGQDRGGVSASFYHQAFICRQLRQHIESLQLLNEADSHLPEVRSADRWRTPILSERIFNLMNLRRYDEALPKLDAWISKKDGQYTPSLVRGDVCRERGDRRGALEDYCRAASLLSSSIVGLRTERFQQSDHVRHQSEFDQFLEAALEADEPEVAVVLLELSNTAALGSGAVGTTPRDLEKELDLRAQAGKLAQASAEATGKHDASAIASADEQAMWLVSEREFLYSEEKPLPPSVEDARQAGLQIAGKVPAGTMVLEFASVAGQMWVLGVSREGIEAKPTGLTVMDVALLARSFQFECKGRFPVEALERLSSALLGPISKWIATKNRLLILPGPFLQGIPFQALPWEGKPLIEYLAVSYITSSLTRLGWHPTQERAYGPEMDATFIGVPRVSYARAPALPGVRDEVSRIQRLFSSPLVHADPPATSSQLLDSASITGVLHVSCHGVYEDGSPLMSRLLLADRPVFAFEIIMVGFQAQLVVLSACQTAEGIMQPGGYIQSIASAFLKSGVGAVVAAFWPVDDNAGSAFAQLFYQELLRDHGSPTSALIAAQRELRRQPDFEHPYFWAPFSVFSASGGEY